MPAANSNSLENTVLPALRQDLVVSRQIYEGKDYHVIKDPISLKYFRLSAEDYFLATLFDGKRTLADIRASFLQQFPQVRLACTPGELTERIVRFANELAMMQFVGVKGASVKRRAEMRDRTKRKKPSPLARIFFFQMSVFDPDELLAAIAKRIPWVWTKTTLWISAGIILAALLVLMQNYARIAPSMGAFFTPRSLVLLWFGIVLVKVIHELGHGLTCKHFGGEVHEIGVMVMLFTPFFYVNVTDSWMMPKKRHRILIASAGIYVELVIAALATFLWAITQPGILQQALFNIMLVTSFWTIFFNANPLSRFDGYYILTDLLEMPNLRTKARVYMNSVVQKLLFGRKARTSLLSQMPMPEKHFALFFGYAVFSYVWWLLVLTRMTHIFTRLLSPYGLEQLGSILSGFVVVGYIILPCVLFFTRLGFTADDWLPGGRTRRLTWIVSVLLTACLAACLVPVERTITRSSAIELASPQIIRPMVAGFVEDIYVKEGDLVKQGDPIARLSNRDVAEDLQIARLRQQIAEKEALRAFGIDKPVDFLEAKNLKEQSGSAAAEAERDYSHLILRAESDGVVLTPNLERKKGVMVRQGELFCEISPLRSMLIKIPLVENEVRYVNKGQAVRLKVFAHPEATFTGFIVQRPLSMMGKDLPPNLSTSRKGDIPTKPDHDGKEIPAARVYSAQVNVSNPDALLRPGMSGRVKIFAGRLPLGKLVAQGLLDLISLDSRL